METRGLNVAATRSLIGALCLMLPLSLAADEDFQRILALMRAGNYAEAYCSLRPLAERGAQQAEYLLGWMYHNGYGMAIDDQQAQMWWSRSAAQGNLDALFALAQLYELEDSDTAKANKAIDYYIQGARRNHEDSRQMLRTRLAQARKTGEQRLLQLLEDDWSLFRAPLRVSGSDVNIRNGPGTWFSVLTTLADGDPLVELARDGQWIKVGIAGSREIGWVHSSLVISPD